MEKIRELQKDIIDLNLSYLEAHETKQMLIYSASEYMKMSEDYEDSIEHIKKGLEQVTIQIETIGQIIIDKEQQIRDLILLN